MIWRTQRIAGVVAGLTLLVSAAASCSGGGPPERRFAITGKILALDPECQQVTLAHEAIPGYMEAMTMPFNVKDAWVMKVLAPGHTIQGTLVVTEERSWIEDITVIESASSDAAAGGGSGDEEPAPGTAVTGFAFFNQDGKRIRLEDYRGKLLLITFIYTRCPLPDFCPRMSRNFSRVQAEMRREARLGSGAHLLSISFDTERDTAAVLRKYGSSYVDKSEAEPFRYWEFAGGSPDEIRRAAQFFGLTYSNENGQISHTLRTALIGPDGRLLRLYRGNSWTPEDVLAEMRRALAE